MTDEQKRAAVIAMYPNSTSWKRRVAKMSGAQVFAIWAREQKKQEPKPDKPEQDDIPF